MYIKFLINLSIFVILCVLIYIVFSNINMREGLTNQGSQANNGIGGNAESYAALLKTMTIEKQDTLLISKYRKQYENAILNMDDLLNNLMLETVLKYDNKDPNKTIVTLANFNQAKTALNSVMKFVDSSA